MYQFDLFQRHIPPCGRRNTPFCEVVEECSTNTKFGIIRCIWCNTIAFSTTVASS